MKSTTIRIPGEVELEALLEDDGGSPAKACVICHPHPRYGGDMENNVVLAIGKGVRRAGLASLRFNFRGVGASRGSYSGGEGEVEDVKACLRFLSEAGYERLAIAGYSFGAWAGFKAALGEKLVLLLGVAPPLALFDFSFMAASAIPLGLISGDRDSFCSAEAMRDWIQTLTCTHERQSLPAGDHFLFGRNDEVARATRDLAGRLAIP